MLQQVIFSPIYSLINFLKYLASRFIQASIKSNSLIGSFQTIDTQYIPNHQKPQVSNLAPWQYRGYIRGSQESKALRSNFTTTSENPIFKRLVGVALSPSIILWVLKFDPLTYGSLAAWCCPPSKAKNVSGPSINLTSEENEERRELLLAS